MSDDEDRSSGVAFILYMLLTAAFVMFWIWRSNMESAAYNRLTGAHTTAWDAMFLELRVQDQPNKEQP
jgi:hypothetical protein